jgi:hypothetical protein
MPTKPYSDISLTEMIMVLMITAMFLGTLYAGAYQVIELNQTRISLRQCVETLELLEPVR